MFTRPDNTYNDIREKSLMQWLDEMEQHSDVAVRALRAFYCHEKEPAQETARIAWRRKNL